MPSLHAEDRAGHLTSAQEPGWFGSVGSGSDDNYYTASETAPCSDWPPNGLVCLGSRVAAYGLLCVGVAF